MHILMLRLAHEMYLQAHTMTENHEHIWVRKMLTQVQQWPFHIISFGVDCSRGLFGVHMTHLDSRQPETVINIILGTPVLKGWVTFFNSLDLFTQLRLVLKGA